jgi:PAS domain S-box-containing protein
MTAPKKRSRPGNSSALKPRPPVRGKKKKPAAVRGALVVVLDAKGRVLRWNEAFAAACNLHPEEISGRSALSMFLPAHEPEKFTGLLDRALSGVGDLSLEAPLNPRDGTRRSILWSLCACPDARGKQVICAGIDVSDEHRARELAEQRQQELLHMYRLHSAGGLAAAMAHELGQPLAAVVSYCEASMQELRSERPDPEKQNRNLGRAVAEAHRAAKLIRELRGFILKRQADSERFEMETVVAAALNLVGPQARARHVRIETQAERNLPPVKGRVVQIEQLLVNLLNNAIDSISAAGSMSGLITIHTRRDPSGVVQVSIEDSGPGLDTQVARRMFDPFFTTKAGGLGIGLMIARSIAEAHGGRLWAEQAASGGTVFHFSVPFWN